MMKHLLLLLTLGTCLVYPHGATVGGNKFVAQYTVIIDVVVIAEDIDTNTNSLTPAATEEINARLDEFESELRKSNYRWITQPPRDKFLAEINEAGTFYIIYYARKID